MGFEAADFASTGAVVVDNSVTMRWIVDDGSSRDRRYASAVFNRVSREGLVPVVPTLWVCEAAFVVSYYASRGELSEQHAQAHLSALFDLCAVVPGSSTPMALFSDSRSESISAYDLAYLQLAEEHALPLATLDRKMRKVARRTGIPVF